MADAVVVGLGAVGAATVRALTLRGARVVGLDPRPAAHDQGSSHGGSRILRRALFEHPDYVAVVDRAIALWRELEEAADRHVFDERVGLLLAGPPGSALLRGTREAAAAHGLPIQEASLAGDRPAVFALPPGHEALWDPDGGILRPEEAVRSQLDDAGRRGAHLRHGVAVTRWTPREGGGAVLETREGTLEAERVVLAAGPWAPALLGPSAPPLRLLRKVLRWHRAREPRRWRLGAVPVFAFEDGGSLLYGFPALDDRGVKVADHAGGALVAEPGHGLEPGEEDARIDALRRRFLRGLEDAPSARATCLYTMTADTHPLVGELPEAPGVFVAAGFSGHGFKHSIAFGEALAELTLDGRAGLPLDLFSPARFSSRRR